MLHSQLFHNHNQFLFSKLPIIPASKTQKPTKTLHIVSAIPPLETTTISLITELSSQMGSGGSIELPFAATPFLLTATNDPSSVVQVASSVLVTGATAAFFFRSVLSRVKRAKQLKFRSSGVSNSLNSLKAMQSKTIKAKKAKHTPDQTLLGAIIAGVVAIGLYKMTTTIETALNHQTISDSFSVRQVTITIRTMINGICYLATFIYGFNSLGLFLYTGQLVLNSLMIVSNDGNKIESRVSESNSSFGKLNDNINNELSTMKEDQSPNKSQ